jgi:t-SNARE complex subunit (syntaxin)
MARARTSRNGRLEDAVATLIQTQAAFVARHAQIKAQMAETSRLNSEHFARIEATLAELVRLLQELPEAVRAKFGFRMPEQPSAD